MPLAWLWRAQFVASTHLKQHVPWGDKSELRLLSTRNMIIYLFLLDVI